MVDNEFQFMSMLMGEEDFVEMFVKFSDEEQNRFIDALADVMYRSMRAIKNAPLELKAEWFAASMAGLPDELKKEASAVLGSGNINEILEEMESWGDED